MVTYVNNKMEYKDISFNTVHVNPDKYCMTAKFIDNGKDHYGTYIGLVSEKFIANKSSVFNKNAHSLFYVPYDGRIYINGEL